MNADSAYAYTMEESGYFDEFGVVEDFGPGAQIFFEGTTTNLHSENIEAEAKKIIRKHTSAMDAEIAAILRRYEAQIINELQLLPSRGDGIEITRVEVEEC